MRIRSTVAALVTVAAAVTAVTAVEAARAPLPTTSHPALCAGLADLRSSFDVRTLAGQSGIRRAGSALAVLADHYPVVAQQDAVPAQEAGGALRTVLSLRYGTARDLWTAARPVAVACGQDWRSVEDSIYRIEGGS